MPYRSVLLGIRLGGLGLGRGVRLVVVLCRLVGRRSLVVGVLRRGLRLARGRGRGGLLSGRLRRHRLSHGLLSRSLRGGRLLSGSLLSGRLLGGRLLSGRRNPGGWLAGGDLAGLLLLVDLAECDGEPADEGVEGADEATDGRGDDADELPVENFAGGQARNGADLLGVDGGPVEQATLEGE